MVKGTSSGQFRAEQLDIVTLPLLQGANSRRSTRKDKSSGGRWKGGGPGEGMVGQVHVMEEGPETEAVPEAWAGPADQEARVGPARL